MLRFGGSSLTFCYILESISYTTKMGKFGRQGKFTVWVWDKIKPISARVNSSPHICTAILRDQCKDEAVPRVSVSAGWTTTWSWYENSHFRCDVVSNFSNIPIKIEGLSLSCSSSALRSITLKQSYVRAVLFGSVIPNSCAKSTISSSVTPERNRNQMEPAWHSGS